MNAPKPLSYRRALRVLYRREQPHERLLDYRHGEIVAHLKKRASVRMVADLFGLEPKRVAQDLMRVGGRRQENLAVMGRFVEQGMGVSLKENKPNQPLWATGRGAW